MTRADFEAEMAHQRCVQALQYDPATGDVARAWVTSYRQRSTANGQPISIEQAYQTFDLWNRRRGAAPGPHPTAPPVTGARAAAPATVPAATGPAGLATYVPPAQPPGAYPPGSIPNQPGVVPPTTAMYPTLPAGQPGNPAQTALNLEAAAQAREAARMAGTPGYGAGGGARPTGGQPVDQEFEDLGLRAPHSAEFLDRVDDSEVARQLAAEAGGQF